MFQLFVRWSLLLLCLSLGQHVWSAIKEYHLYIDQQQVNITGKVLKKYTVNGKFIAPTLTFEEGDDAVIVVHNQLKKEDTALHWHGLLLPGLMDGVPGFNGFQGIKPQQSFTYRFKVRQSGTYWYHAHSRSQEQDGLYGALIIYPKNHKPLQAAEKAEQDFVIMLSDFHETDGNQIMRNLKKSAEYYQNRRETLTDVMRQAKTQGLQNTWQDRKMWNQMRMLKTDLSDVTGYHFLVNGLTNKQNWTGHFSQGDKIRLRFINASAMSFFDVRIPNLKMTVVSADGQAVKPVNVDEFRIGTAETYDVIVEPQQSQYQIQAESIDRSGFALGTLLQKNTQPIAMPVPQARPRALLSDSDMPMSHTTHAEHTTVSTQTKTTPTESVSSNHMHHQAVDVAMEDMDHEMDMEQKTDHSQHKVLSNTESSSQTVSGWANASTLSHHKALQYQDLKSLTPQTDLRAPEKDIVIRLGGTMERYIWTINGKKFNEAEPLKVNYGDRVRLTFINDSMMAHPMHLHGMFMQLENGQTMQDLPNKHTIVIPPNKTVTALLTANELGEWAIHCHLLYHMSAGMMNKLIVAYATPSSTKSSDQVIENQPTHSHQTQPAHEGDDHAHH